MVEFDYKMKNLAALDGIGVIERVESKAIEDSLNEVQALHTALCFLCSVNAGVAEVETFLTNHPEALLLDGTGYLEDESARIIVEEQMSRCECYDAACNQNRRYVISVLDKGFEHYQDRHFRQESTSCQQSWGIYAGKLLKLEHNIRNRRVQELTMRHRVLQAAIEVHSFQDQLEQILSKSTTGLALFKCHWNQDTFARRSVLEYQHGVALVNLSTIEREHKGLLRKIREGRRTQFVLLKRVFDGVQRRVCLSTRTQSPVPPIL
jgi:hypothetical protein